MALVIERKIDQHQPAASELALVAKDVVKAFQSSGKDEKHKRVRAVDGISLSVPRGEIYGLLGANGSGKSTLIRLFSTLLEADSGEVTIFGHDVQDDEMAVKRLINRVSVEASFFKKLSAMENLVYAGRLYGIAPAQSRTRATKILERLGIDAKRHNEPLEKLSRGMQQKVAIARAFLTSPTLLLLDEPTTGLDIRSKREVQAFVRELRAEHDATILLTTHDLEEAERLSDRIGIVERGKLVAEGTVSELRATANASTLEEAFMSLTGHKLEDADERTEAQAR
ncbi:MAG: ABC transporter [Chloroflexi bacterium 13_1_40CM_4_68_4]|nr:MAG: ABC transporter [Chloroflexi bacterium 13_1_40CM_4_68_4]